jgi:hypothetical protein
MELLNRNMRLSMPYINKVDLTKLQQSVPIKSFNGSNEKLHLARPVSDKSYKDKKASA